MATSSAGECGCRERSCDALVAGQAWDQAAAVCRDTYERTRSTAAGVAAARSLLRHGEPEEAEHLARILTTSDRAGDAFLVLGDAAAQRDDSDASMAAYDEAARACQRENNEAGASRAQNGLAGVWLARGNLAKAMEASQLAIDHAVHAADLPMQLYARLGHADLLRRQGLLVAAEEELAHAADLARTPRDQAWVALKHGILYIELDLDSLARSHLERVLVTARSGLVAPEVVMAAHLNLAWVERRAGNLAGAMHHVEDAAAIDANDIDVRVNRALVLADQERLDDAAHELTLAAQGTAGQRLWWVAYNQGLIAGRRRDVEGQLTAFRRSIEGVRAMSSHAGSYAPDVAASHREPFLRLIGVHARRAEWKTALGLVMELDALALLSTERPPPQHPVDISSAKPVGPSTVAKVPAVETVVEAWRGRRLVIVASDEETLWRLEIRDGRVTGEAVGVAAALETVARRLEADPTDAVAAGALGAAIVPPGVEGELLDVLLIGAIARTPLAALMHDGHMIIGRTPLARVLGILPRAAHPARSGASVVLGDPREDLPSARAEAIAVAATLGVAPQLGREATSSALAGARGAGLLHIAAHSVIDTEGPRLLLADRAVSPADILASDGAPAVVVLASCGGTEARDDAGWGSLAAAYIAAGADAVLASSWSVEDAATRRFVEELYRHPVREQPASALAAAQVSSRAALPARVWAGFTIIAAPPPLSL